jgi:deoxycytidylate deaminase
VKLFTKIYSGANVIKRPELVFGLVGPIGVDMDMVSEKLASALRGVGYEALHIRATEVMERIPVSRPLLKTGDPLEVYGSKIDYANAVREACQSNSAIAGLVMLQIRDLRSKANLKEGKDLKESFFIPRDSVAYIVRQFKRKEEVDALRLAYGKKFLQVSVGASRADIKKSLKSKIELNNPDVSRERADQVADELMQRDLDESAIKRGQRVGEVFQHGDVFINASDDVRAEHTINRFIGAFFGKNNISPNQDEYGMYIATSASFRSIDTSRQVGSAIFSRDTEVIALGCNEVPKFGGGTYWVGDKKSHRDIEDGHDANMVNKRRIIYDFVNRLCIQGYISDKAPKDLFGTVMESDSFKDALIMDITEYGRMTHAEMNSITDAARLGRSVKGAYMYVTTFPCHNCAKHIVASGIDRVVYIEPYPKSRALELHDDSISLSGEMGKLRFEHFFGISPRRYRDIFQKSKRRSSDGAMNDWYYSDPYPMSVDNYPHYVYDELAEIGSSIGDYIDHLELN